MNVLVVIQARLGPTRLPGKVLMDLGGKPVLQWVVERAQREGYPVIVAGRAKDLGRTPSLAPSCGSFWWDGDENGVLGRFVAAVTWDGGPMPPNAHIPYKPRPTPAIVVRITADCPCLDPALIRQAPEAIEAGHD